MDAFTLFTFIASLFGDKKSSGCDKIAPCTCQNDPVTRIQCPSSIQRIPTFSELHARDVKELDFRGVPLKSTKTLEPFRGANISPSSVKLLMSDCQLHDFHSSFFNGISQTVEVLDLRNNYIKSISSFENFKNLETLNLQSNRMSRFPSKVCSAPNLKFINLRHNSIKSDWSSQLNPMIKCSSLEKVYTDATSLSCSCDRLKHYFYYHEKGPPLYKDETGSPLVCNFDSAYGMVARNVEIWFTSHVELSLRICTDLWAFFPWGSVKIVPLLRKDNCRSARIFKDVQGFSVQIVQEFFCGASG